MNEREILNTVRDAYRRILGDKLTGIYVHGSIAFGCFRWERSDIDFLVVTEEPPTQQEKEALIRTLLELDACAPPKGFEMSVVPRSACMPFQDPVPFELHYSNAYREAYRRELRGTCQTMQGFDPDLAAHMTVTGRVGIALCGFPVKQVFAPVPKASYLASIRQDAEDAREGIGRDPVYYVLNLCRVLACVREDLVLSKEQGGEWGMAHLPGEREWIEPALDAYRGGASVPFPAGLEGFAERMLERIRQECFFERRHQKTLTGCLDLSILFQ